MVNELFRSTTTGRGDRTKAVRSIGHRVRLSTRAANGFTLIELVITITVLTILTLGAMPLVKLAVKRQKEQQLHEALRTIRAAIDEFHRDASPCNVQDPRSRVCISDNTIFGVDNPDRYPPDLDTLKSGVNVVPRLSNAVPGGAAQLATKQKVYLRDIPVDPMTGEKDWCLYSSYDLPDSDCSSGGENVFDVRSKSKDKALNGDNYKDW